MTSDPFKLRVSKPQPKQHLFLTKPELDRLVSNSRPNQYEEEEKASIEERRKRQKETKALSKLIVSRKEPGSELRKRQYIQGVQDTCQELGAQDRIEARKNYVLDLAYKKLFEQTDRVKNFKAAKNLAVMLKERDIQIESKAGMKDMIAQYESEFVLGMLRDIDTHQMEELERLKKVKKDKLKNAENWKKQREEADKKMVQAEWEHLRDGYKVREAALNYVEEIKKEDMRQKKKIRDYKSELDKQRDQKQTIVEIYSQLDEADDKRAKIFNEAKKDMTIKHKEIKSELDKKKEMKRQHVAMNLRDETSAIKAKEEAILQKAILQAEAKYLDKCAIKQANQAEALKDIQDFYEKEMEAKAKREVEERREGYQERRNILDKVDGQMKIEDSKTEAKKNMEKETQHLQLHQIAKRKMDRLAKKQENMEEYLNHMRSLDEEEEIFQKYAQMEIAECEARGIDTRPMQVAARPGVECGKGPLYEHRGHIRPRYYAAAAQGDELSHVKRDLNRPNSKSRLGFMLH